MACTDLMQRFQHSTSADLTLSAFERLRADVMWKPVIAAVDKDTRSASREQSVKICELLTESGRIKLLPSSLVRRLQACLSTTVGHNFGLILAGRRSSFTCYRARVGQCKCAAKHAW